MKILDSEINNDPDNKAHEDGTFSVVTPSRSKVFKTYKGAKRFYDKSRGD